MISDKNKRALTLTLNFRGWDQGKKLSNRANYPTLTITPQVWGLGQNFLLQTETYGANYLPLTPKASES